MDAGEESEMSIEAMKQALEALESCTPEDTSTGHVVWPSYDEQAVEKATTALRTAIEQAEKQEPVATVVSENKPVTMSWWHEPALPVGTKLYTTPPAAQRQWVGLSEEEIDKLKHLIDWTATWSHGRFAYEIEQLLKEKNA